jgi:hypothetical protein
VILLGVQVPVLLAQLAIPKPSGPRWPVRADAFADCAEAGIVVHPRIRLQEPGERRRTVGPLTEERAGERLQRGTLERHLTYVIDVGCRIQRGPIRTRLKARPES